MAALGQLLSDPACRLAVVKALTRIHHPSAAALLVTVLEDENPELRTLALEALTQFRNPELLLMLEVALTDPAATVRRVAVQGLVSLRSQIDAHRYVALLEPSLQDGDLDVAKVAIYALGRTNSDAATMALEKLVVATATPNLLRQAGIKALGFQESEGAVACLARLWPSGLEDDRLAMVAALSRQQEPSQQAIAATLLMKWLAGLDCSATALRQSAAFGLGQLGVETATATLQGLLSDPDERVRLHAAAALQRLTEAAKV